VKWGTDPLDDGIQINLLDEQSGIFAHVPFAGDALRDLTIALSKHLTEDQKREVLPHLNGGIHLPGRDFSPTDIRSEGPPQG
jgi:hypothetical protein